MPIKRREFRPGKQTGCGCWMGLGFLRFREDNCQMVYCFCGCSVERW